MGDMRIMGMRSLRVCTMVVNYLAGGGLLNGRSALGGGGSMAPGIVNSAGSICGDLNLEFLHIELA